MGFFRPNKNGEESAEQADKPVNSQNFPPNINNNRRRRSSDLSSSRSVSASAKTISTGNNCTSIRNTSGSSGQTRATDILSNFSSHSRSGSSKKHRAMFPGNSSASNCSGRDICASMRSFVSDLDIESAADTTSSNELEKNRQKQPQHHEKREQGTDCTSSGEIFPSNDFTLASVSSVNNCNNSNVNNCNNSMYSTGAKSKASYRSRRSKRSNSQNDHIVSELECDESVANSVANSVASASVMMDKTRAENVGRSSTRVVYIVLLLTGAILSTFIFVFVARNEQKNFELEFRSFARETADLAGTNADHTFSKLQTLATTVASEGIPEREWIHYSNNGMVIEDVVTNTKVYSWPNVTIPHFDERIADFSESFGAIMLLYVPLVQARDRESWEYYANQHSPWRTSIKDRDDIFLPSKEVAGNLIIEFDGINSSSTNTIHNEEDGSHRRNLGDMHSMEWMENDDDFSHGSHHHGNSDGFLRIHPCTHLDENLIRVDYLDVDNFMDSVLEDEGGFENPQGIAAPIYQYGGPGHERTENSGIALMDLMSHPIFKKEVITSIEYDVPVISEYLDSSFLVDGLSTLDSKYGNVTTLWHSQYSVYDNHQDQDNNIANEAGRNPVDLPLPSIRSLALYPVKETFEDHSRTIGFVVGVVPWHTYFQNVLKTSKEPTEDSTSTKDDDLFEEKINGIVVKVSSNCGSVFTFVLDYQKETTNVRLGDWDELYDKYQDLVYTSRFFGKEQPDGYSLFCYYDLHIYPSDEFRDAFRTNDAWTYALTVWGIFLFTALLFSCYDRLIFKGQQYIVNEATGMIVENARRAAKNERELNDFIAHEVRNPLAAAISACAFVSSAITEDEERWNDRNSGGIETERLALIASKEKRMEVQDDINIIDSSLNFINDLLRNMLDMQRAGSNQIKIEKKPTDIMNDIFKPVEAMLHLRDAPFKVIMEVESGTDNGSDEDGALVVMTDPMRLKQVLLNLTRNATKFVEKGFIRCSANVNPINGMVELRVDDSGPGIPQEKRGNVFGKFQESLDSLQQGTGIGLSLCKKMIDLMGGSLFIDEDYRSGISNYPGTRFVIQLKIAPMQLSKLGFESEITSYDRARLRHQHMLACMDPSSVENLPSIDSCEGQFNAISSSMSSNARDTVSVSDIELEPCQQESVDVMTEVISSIGEPVDEKERVKEQGDVEQGLASISSPVVFESPIAIEKGSDGLEEKKEQQGQFTELPKNLSVLFVDDDMVLRKLFARTLRRINPTWTCKEASSGETAIEVITRNWEEKLLENDNTAEGSTNGEADCGFDLIFMDQYMASVQKQLLGTETVRKIRAKGFQKPIICGLSANDVEDAFYHAGSDAFMFKPFPCKKDELEKELLKVMNSTIRRR